MAHFKELGNSKYKVGKYQEAVDAYTSAIEADPSEATYHGNRAAALLMLKKYDEALQDCKQAIKMDPMFVKAFVRFLTLSFSLLGAQFSEGDKLVCSNDLYRVEYCGRGAKCFSQRGMVFEAKGLLNEFGDSRSVNIFDSARFSWCINMHVNSHSRSRKCYATHPAAVLTWCSFELQLCRNQ